jgi:hypothetical protein
MSLEKLVGAPLNISTGKATQNGAKRPDSVKLGGEGSWPAGKNTRNIGGVKVKDNPGRHGSLLD